MNWIFSTTAAEADATEKISKYRQYLELVMILFKQPREAEKSFVTEINKIIGNPATYPFSVFRISINL